MKRQEKAALTRTNILQAAMELFTQKSFDDVSVTEITEQANCSVGAFYGHFKSKQEVATRVWVDMMVNIMKQDTEGGQSITGKEDFVDYLLDRSEASTVSLVMNNLRRYCFLTDEDSAELLTYSLRYQSLIKNMLAANAPGASEETLWSYASVIHALLNTVAEKSNKTSPFVSLTRDILRQTILMIIDACRNGPQEAPETGT